MKIVFVIEYFPPFAAGGSEWSTYYLAKDLAASGQEVVVLTPNYGAKKKEYIDGIRVLRFPFYLKLKDRNKLPGNFALTNPLWFIWVAVNLFLLIKKENPDVIHVQGKYSVPPAVIANLFFKKPLVATVRDYLVICNYGICLMDSDKACNLKDYFFRDFKSYLNLYLAKKNFLSIVTNLIFAIWGRFSKNYLKFFINQADYLICLSKKQETIFAKNGITPKIESIYTNYVFNKVNSPEKALTNILYVGRLTYGKGIGLFLRAIPIVKKKVKGVTFTIIGDGIFRKEVKKIADADRTVRYEPYIDHQKLQKYFQKSRLTVVPSIWPDPLPRIAMESIARGTPVIATNSGGLPEVVKNGLYGYLAEKNSADLANKIILGIKNEKVLRNNIKRDFKKLSNDFGSKLALRYIEIYKSLVLKK